MTNIASPTCYQLSVVTDKFSYSAPANSSGVATISQQLNQYTSGTNVYLSLAKTCSLPIQEAPNFVISYHF